MRGLSAWSVGRRAAVFGALLSVSIWSASANADQRVRCESIDGRQNYCSADTRGGVRLARQLSKSGCYEGSTWGFDRRGIWVSNGCRAEFIVFESRGRSYYPPEDRDDRGGRGRDDGRDGRWDRGHGPREDQRVRCESDRHRYTSCRVDVGYGRVEILRQFSDEDCRFNRSWGYDRRQIWVDGGCRAEFVIVR